MTPQSLDSVHRMALRMFPVVAGEESLLDGAEKGAVCAYGEAATDFLVELVVANALTCELVQMISMRPKMTECSQLVIAAVTQLLLQASFMLQTNCSLYAEV